MLLARGQISQAFVGHLEQERLSGPERLGDAGRRKLARKAPAEVADQPQSLGVAVGNRNPLEASLLVGDLNRAPVGEVGNQQAWHLLERCPVVARVREQL